MADYNYFYYSSDRGLTWAKQKVLHPNSFEYNNLQFEDSTYAIVNESSLTSLYAKRPGNEKWVHAGNLGITGAVTGLVLDKNECWVAEGFDTKNNYYSSDSAKTFTPFIADSSSGFIMMTRAGNERSVFGATFGTGGRLWVNRRSNNQSVNSEQPAVNKKSETKTTSLFQNIPNPFNHTTTINYTLPQQSRNGGTAKIIITDKSGKVLKEINLPAGRQSPSANKGSVNIDASTLSSGAYQYLLYVDGRLIDTKQMEHLK